MASNEKDLLGTEKIGTLLRQFAVPSIIAMVVSALYNMVDQFFIGRSIGILGNAATNVAFPLTIICTSISLLCGVGGAANFNLAMGRRDPEKARRFIGTAVAMLVTFGVVLCVGVRLFLRPLMLAFGADQDTLAYSLTYTGITSFGFPFLILTTGGTNLIRADGSPRYSMLCNLTGAVINTILDPVLMFGFDMGMAGAAIATVAGQVVSGCMVAGYLTRFRTVPLRLGDIRLSPQCCAKVASLGMAPFFNQMAMMVVQVVLNNTLTYYGGQSVYGSSIPLACAGIISKVGMIFFSLVIGLAQGLQPICSYNYGAQNYARVRETYVKAVMVGTAISTVAFLCFQLFPRQIIAIFGTGSEEYFRFAENYFRIYLFFTFLNAFQPITANFFTSIGKASRGIFMSLTRQILFLLPLIVILPMFFGIDGVMYAAPVADGIAAALAILFVRAEFRRLWQLEQTREESAEKVITA